MKRPFPLNGNGLLVMAASLSVAAQAAEQKGGLMEFLLSRLPRDDAKLAEKPMAATTPQ